MKRLALLVAASTVAASAGGQSHATRLSFHAAPKALAPSAVTSEWPRLLGPTHNATSPETRLLHRLPEAGPRVVWELAKGSGFGGPAIAGDRLVLFHRVGNRESVECVRAENGAPLWSFDYAAPYRPRYGGSEGPRTSPVIAGQSVFSFGITAQLHCLDLATGAVRWKRDLAAELQMTPAFFGHGSTPLVLGTRLIVQVGGKWRGEAINTACFDAESGELIWTTPHAWGASYASPIPAQLQGKQCVLVFAGGESDPPTGGLLVIDAATGAVLGSAPHRAEIRESVSASSPVLIEQIGSLPRVIVSEAYSAGGAGLEVSPDFKIRELWKAPGFGLYWMTPIVRAGCVFGFSGLGERLSELVCCDLVTGKELWRNDLGGGFGRGSLLSVDSGVLCLGEFGDLAWLELSARGVEVKSRAKLFNAPETWTLPAISRGLLYVSQNEQGAAGTKPRLICYDLRGD
ncbi:MAG: Pyrrolo-quinoline quinone [Chthoniobacter sp.]|nr:Pyrrolo-quinoline quinone [Chthoniobacter sp.]